MAASLYRMAQERSAGVSADLKPPMGTDMRIFPLFRFDLWQSTPQLYRSVRKSMYRQPKAQNYPTEKFTMGCFSHWISAMRLKISASMSSLHLAIKARSSETSG